MKWILAVAIVLAAGMVVACIHGSAGATEEMSGNCTVPLAWGEPIGITMISRQVFVGFEDAQGAIRYATCNTGLVHWRVMERTNSTSGTARLMGQ